MDCVELERHDMLIHKLQFKCTFRHFADVDLHPGQLHFLMLLHEQGRLNQTDCARKLGVSSASIGMSVRRLEKAGLIKKSADKNDLRVTKIELTARGKQMADDAKMAGEDLLRIKYAGFSETEIEQLSVYQKKILKNMKTYYENREGEQQ